MIAPTGTIRIITIKGGGFKNGNPQKVSVSKGDPIPANIKTTKQQVYDTGSQAWVTRQGFTILIDASTPEVEDLRKVEIIDSREKTRGEFDVQNAQYLDYVDAIQLTI